MFLIITSNTLLREGTFLRNIYFYCLNIVDGKMISAVSDINSLGDD